jgi:hypothetical protein
VNQNPLWIVRVDENYAADCSAATGDGNGNAITQFKLYYYDAGGSVVTLGTYQADNSDIGATDLSWVTPGVTSGLSDVTGSFEFDFSAIPTGTGDARSIYLDVATTSGSSMNVWDIAARPPDGVYGGGSLVGIPVPAANVNDRNLQIANSPFTKSFARVEILAIGWLSVFHLNSGVVNLPLAPIDARQGGGGIYTSAFDYEVGGSQSIDFTIDTVLCTDPPAGFCVEADVVASNPDPLAFETTCNGTDCNNSWMRPQIQLGIPTEAAGFFGGTLYAEYVGNQDAHTWYLSITDGRPFLTR